MELCLDERRVRVWVWDHFREGAPIDVTGGKGLVTVTVRGTQATVIIHPQRGNLLEGEMDPVKTPSSAITVSVQLPARASRTARFIDLKRAYGCNS